MRKTSVITLTLLGLLFQSCSNSKDNAVNQAIREDGSLCIRLQQGELKNGKWVITNHTENWKLEETAIIICDMWDKHWCDISSDRVAEMGPALNHVITIAREKGVTIVHAPSECMDYYAEYPARKEALKYVDETLVASSALLPAEENAEWPFDITDEGCESPECKPYRAWTKQMDALPIKDNDLISDSGVEIESYFKEKGIKNVILTGVAANMCVIARSFGLRSMKRMGMNVTLMRDMTDLMYNPEKPPYVGHFEGLNLMVEYIEKYVCPSLVSTDFTGKKPFKFYEDPLR